MTYIGIKFSSQHPGMPGYIQLENAIYPSPIPPNILLFHAGYLQTMPML